MTLPHQDNKPEDILREGFKVYLADVNKINSELYLLNMQLNAELVKQGKAPVPAELTSPSFQDFQYWVYQSGHYEVKKEIK